MQRGHAVTTNHSESGGQRDRDDRTARLLETFHLVAGRARTEEDLRVGLERALRDAFPALPEPRYEHAAQTATYLGRADAVHTHFVIEYEPPRSLRSAPRTAHAVRQVEDYLTALVHPGRESQASDFTFAEEERLGSVVGIATDGHAIVFVQRRRRVWHTEKSAISVDTLERLERWLLSTSRRDLSAANLIEDFGPTTELASHLVRTLAHLVQAGTHPKASIVYDEWQRIFGIVYGEDQLHRTGRTEEHGDLAEAYQVALREVPFGVLLFAIHTYYALLMKMLATELIVAQGPFGDSFIGNLSRSILRRQLAELESGELLQSRNIRNVIEQDFFGWYTSAWSKELGDALWAFAEKLSTYDIGTFELKPDRARDLLKDLYHGLIPESVRHALGEYYTPDWLAEHTLELSGYTGDPHHAILDPSCGSGTFLVLSILRVRQWLSDHAPEWTTPARRREALELILAHVVGFDLNPLAVIASRTNYLFALGPLLRYHGGRQPLEIPVYLTDSVLLPGRVDDQRDLYSRDTIAFPMVVGTFEVPRQIVERHLVPELMGLLHEAVVEHHTRDAFVARSVDTLQLVSTEDLVDALGGLHAAMVTLDQQGKNRIWTKLIQNRYAALFYHQRFDFVVGNPPHVNWESLTPAWRLAAEKSYRGYGLFTLSGLESRHGGGKKDIAALFTYAVVDHFLRSGGVLALVLHVSLLKTSGAGEGYRRFRLGGGEPFKVDAAHDFASFQPFLTRPGMKIKTRTLTLRAVKGQVTTYPVSYTKWKKTAPGYMPGDLSWMDAQTRLASSVGSAVPVRGTNAGILSPWLTLPQEDLQAVLPLRAPDGYEPHYQAHAGLYTGGLNGVYFVRILERHNDGTVLIENRHDVGKIPVPHVRTLVEDRFLYPLVRGRGVARWRYAPDEHVLVVQDPTTQSGYSPTYLQQHYPRTWAYLHRFKRILSGRAAFKKFFDPKKDAFYSMYAVANYTFSTHKVVWMDIASTVKACVISEVEGETLPIPEHKLMFIATASADEAHYLCAVMNSRLFCLVVGGYIVDNSVSTHPIENITIPPFDPSAALHLGLAGDSRRAHTAAAIGDASGLAAAEADIDETVGGLWE
jgi:hypothetical protein